MAGSLILRCAAIFRCGVGSSLSDRSRFLSGFMSELSEAVSRPRMVKLVAGFVSGELGELAMW